MNWPPSGIDAPPHTTSAEAVTAYLAVYSRLQSQYLRVNLAIFVGTIAQMALSVLYLPPQFSDRWWSSLLFQVPWFVYFVVTFVRVPPPIPPSQFRRVLLFILSWYIGVMTVFAVLAILTERPIYNRTPQEEAIAWFVAICCAAIAGPPLVRLSSDLAKIRIL